MNQQTDNKTWDNCASEEAQRQREGNNIPFADTILFLALVSLTIRRT